MSSQDPSSRRADRPTILVGYSGHGLVVADAIIRSGGVLTGYCDREKKSANPHDLAFLGGEVEAVKAPSLRDADWFVGIGDNTVRRRVVLQLSAWVTLRPAVLDPSAVLSTHSDVQGGTFVGPRAVVQCLARVGQGAIINTGAIVEHECHVGDFAHICPGAVLTGNVFVGEGALVGAGTVVRPGVRIGAWATVGCGTVVVRDVEPGETVIGNPARPIPHRSPPSKPADSR